MAIRERLYTVDEFWEIISRPENADRKLELINGEIVEVTPTEEHGSVTTDLITFLNVFVKKHMLGRVVNEVSYKNPADVYNNRIPDISFTRTERLKPLVTQGASTQMHDLVIAVRSPGNTRKGLQEKAVYFIQNGVLLVWIVHPQETWLRYTALVSRWRHLVSRTISTARVCCQGSGWRCVNCSGTNNRLTYRLLACKIVIPTISSSS